MFYSCVMNKRKPNLWYQGRKSYEIPDVILCSLNHYLRIIENLICLVTLLWKLVLSSSKILILLTNVKLWNWQYGPNIRNTDTVQQSIQFYQSCIFIKHWGSHISKTIKDMNTIPKDFHSGLHSTHNFWIKPAIPFVDSRHLVLNIWMTAL